MARNTNSESASRSLNLNCIEKLLECPVCLDTCQPPIYICVNGHDICGECRKSLSVCPLCRQCFSGTRNVTAEKLAEQIRNAVAQPKQSKQTTNNYCFSHLDGCEEQADIPAGYCIEHLESSHNIVIGKCLISGMFSLSSGARKFAVQYNQVQSAIRISIAFHRTVGDLNIFKATLTIGNANILSKLEWKGPVRHLTTDQNTTYFVNYAASGTCIKADTKLKSNVQQIQRSSVRVNEGASSPNHAPPQEWTEGLLTPQSTLGGTRTPPSTTRETSSPEPALNRTSNVLPTFLSSLAIAIPILEYSLRKILNSHVEATNALISGHQVLLPAFDVETLEPQATTSEALSSQPILRGPLTNPVPQPINTLTNDQSQSSRKGIYEEAEPERNNYVSAKPA